MQQDQQKLPLLWVMEGSEPSAQGRQERRQQQQLQEEYHCHRAHVQPRVDCWFEQMMFEQVGGEDWQLLPALLQQEVQPLGQQLKLKRPRVIKPLHLQLQLHSAESQSPLMLFEWVGQQLQGSEWQLSWREEGGRGGLVALEGGDAPPVPPALLPVRTGSVSPAPTAAGAGTAGAALSSSLLFVEGSTGGLSLSHASTACRRACVPAPGMRFDVRRAGGATVLLIVVGGFQKNTPKNKSKCNGSATARVSPCAAPAA
jgi:hypothetical protein